MEEFVGKKVNVIYRWEGEEYSYTGTVIRSVDYLLYLKDVWDPATGATKELVAVNMRALNLVRIETTGDG